MKLVVGLGNPGDRYLATRHNVGFRVVEAWARASGIAAFESRFSGLYGCSPAPKRRWMWRPGRRAAQAHPQWGALLPHTFMNRSGESVAAALEALPVADWSCDFAVVVDDLDLPFGRLRIRPSGGAGGHRGLESLIDHLGTRAFPRLRFGIGRPGPGEDPVGHVLAPFSPAEEARLGEGIESAVNALETLFQAGVSAAMGQFNGLPGLDGPSIAEPAGPAQT